MSFDPDLYLADEGQPDGSSPSPAPAAGSPAGPDESRQIAIVGLAGRFPGARDLDEYWRNLREGRETITFFPESEMELPSWSRFNPKDPNYVRAAGILDDADCFDAGLFGYSPREAQYMDPQQRVFLELCWAALEHAGYDPRATGKRVGVYAGTVYSTYLWMMLGEGVLGNPAERMLATIGNLEDNLTTRVAYKLNLRGPAVTVQTACSSSLVAVNLACQSLLAGKCEMALAGGVAIVFPQKTGYLHNPDLIDSRDGHCRAFCRGSTGAIFSNGAGVVVLKTLAAARRDGDTIHAVILGSAVNNDGNDKIGFTAPSVSGQVAVIREALGQAGVDPATISCIEAHGTGTPLGDPIEIAALAEAFGGNRLPRGSCAIGSVKTNIGHLNSAAGVAGLIKAVLALRHREIPPSLHFEEPNPELDLANTPFYVNARLQPWAQGATPRRIGISSFGIGGTNAHAILQESEAPAPAAPSAGPHVLTVSGRDAAALQARMHRLAAWLDTAAPAPALGDLAFTLNCGRTHFSHRVAFVAESVGEFHAQLRSFLETGHARGALPGGKTADGGPVPPTPESCRFGGAGPDPDDTAHRRSVGALAAAYAAGRNLDWSTYYEAGFFRRLPLPAYPFARIRHWLHARPQAAAAPAGAATPATASSVEELGGDWLQLEDRLFRRKLQVSDPMVGDHRVGGQVVFPGVAHLELARATAAQVTRQPIRRLCQVHWLRPLVIQGVEGEAFVRLEPAAPGCRYTVGCSSPAGDVVHSEGEAFPGPAYPTEQHEAGWLAAFQSTAGPALAGAELHAEFARRGVNYGPHYRGLRSLWTRAGEVLALVEAPPPPPGTANNALPPALLDAALQCTAGLYSESQRLSGAAFLPYSVAEIQLRRPLPHRVYVHVRPHGRETNPDLRRFDLDVLDETGAVCVRFVDLCAKAAPANSPATSTPAHQPAAPAPRQPLAAPAAATVAARPSPAGLEARLQRHFATTLNVAENEIDPDQAYSEYGVDSVLAVGIVKSINDEFHLSLRVTDLFSYSSIRELAAHIISLGPIAPAEPIPAPAPPDPPREVRPDDFAVIGIAGRFPGADHLDDFWPALAQGVDAVAPAPADRWPEKPTDGAAPRPRGGFLRAIAEFDPLFFNLSPLEAEVMDPQQRLFLQEAWRALEDAGYTTARLDNLRCGVFVGVGPSDYGDRLLSHPESVSPQAFTGNATSILAARIAYFLNLKGPTIAIDTACSSSLVAVHLACQSILSGDSDLAIAGGVHVMATPRIHALSLRAGMLSPRGACRTFDQGADGMVLGEGVGAVVLKRLSHALRDGDPIHAVIRGSGVNQDGRTNGITAPSARSQTALEVAVYEKCGVNPDTISYVEAHGTGTPLGDPIELRALTDAFRRSTARTQFCALGSVKTNIGHLMTAAGIASLLKTILCLKHRQIPASLHFAVPNEHCDFAGSPFYVNRTLQPWGHSPAAVLRAAVSSFGFSGTNAHVVLESAPATGAGAPGESAPFHLIALSARSAEALQERTSDLLRWLEAQDKTLDLADLAFTLGARRTHFDLRSAWVVTDRDSLLAALRRGPAAPSLSTDDPALAPDTLLERATALVESLQPGALGAEACRAQLVALARCYEAGAQVPWDRLFAGRPARCLRLPSYPFSRSSHWIPLPGTAAPARPEAGPAAVTRGRRVFQPDEWLVREHRVAGRGMVPGTGWIELALEAASRSQPQAGLPRLHDVTWPAPLALDAADAEVHWELAPDERGGLACRIRSGATADGLTHLQCRLEYNVAPATADASAVDLAAVLQRPPDRNRAAEIYTGFARLGLEYGPRFQGLQAVWSGPREAWGRIVAPDPKELAGCLLHPALLDAALQTTAFVGLAATDPLRGGALPFAIGEIEGVRPLAAEMYARARLLEESTAAGFRTFDIDLFNAEGQRLVSLRRFSVRAAPTPPHDSPPEDDFCYSPVWRAEPLVAGAANPAASPADDPVLILRSAHDGGLGDALARLHPGRRIVTVYLGRRFERLSDRTLAVDATSAADWARLAGEWGGGATLYFLSALAPLASPVDLAGLKAAQEIGVLSFFRLVQAWQCHDRPPGRLSVKVVTASVHQVGEPGADLEPWHATLAGLAKVVSRECPAVAVSTIDLARAELAGDGVAQLAAAIAAESAPAHAHDVALRGGQRFTRHFAAVAPEAAPSSAVLPPFRTGGTYLILGGAGGIGLELARRLVAQYQARLVLVGRRPLDSALAERLRALESLGGAVLYCQADGTDPEAMRRVVEEAHARFGPIHGAIQSALVLRDAALWKMDEAGFRAACEPKVMGSWILAAALATEPLDFLAFFSSAAGVFGNAGQGNYAAGCAFKDAFAHYLSRHRTYPVRVFDWGYWGEAGAVATETYRKQLAKNGMLPLSTAEGLAAFERVMAGPRVQVMPLKLTAAARSALGLGAPATPEGFVGLTAQLHERARTSAPGAELHAGLQALEDHGRRRLVAILDRMAPGGRLPPGDPDTLASLLGIAPRCARVFGALLRCAQRTDRGSAAPAARHPQPAPSDARLQPYWRLLESCLDRLPEILRGSVRATEVLFPGNSLALVEPIYAGNPIADFFNQLLAVASGLTVSAARKPAAGTPIRILEIGAGTGGASVGVLRALQPSGERIEYVYTDVSPVFLEAARVKFAAHGFVSYQTLNIEQEPESQGYAPGSFDLVIASNVLHACDQLRPVLARVHALLKPGGFLLLNELTQASDFLLLTFGLTEGWWKFTDADLRSQDSPLLTCPQWQHVLQQAGFSATAGCGGEPWGDNVLLAQRNTAPARPTPTAPLLAAPAAALSTPVVSPDAPSGTDAEFRSRVSSLLWGHFVQGLKLSGREAAPPPPRASFDRYGVDSLVTTDLIARLERQFGQLPKTLLFEQTSLGALTDYFLQHHRPTLARLLGERPAAPTAAPATPITAAALPPPAVVTAHDRPVRASESAPPDAGEIAIVGVSGRYPLANDIHEFWANLQAGRDCITPIPPERWDVARFNGEQATDENRRSYGTRGGFIRGVDQFDPLFFNISPREAELMDPQERLFLQAAWSAMEDAGYTRHRLSYPHAESGTRQKVGVFAGVMYGSYQLYGAEEWARGRFVNTGSGYWSVANRVSYTLDLEGPSFAVDSACSSSLTALHLACESLRRGECDTALAGGVNLILHPSRYAQLCAVRMLSPDGVCRPFGAGANGFVEGEGVGVLLLKPRAAAERDGDTIYALIKGSAINSGGRTHGYTVPNPGAQANLIRAALDRAGLRADALNYLEAHGTGTALGDPIEVAGLSQAFRTDHAARNACVIGSVKANIGHLEAAAGIASVTKVLLMLKHRRLVPSLHADSPNPLIDFAASPFRLQPTLADWPAPTAANTAGAFAPRRAGISSFGAGGANAHLILEEYIPPARPAPAEPRPQLVVLSAQNPARLTAAAQQLLELARRAGPDLSFDDAIFTLQTGREAFDQRLAFVADDWARLAAQLEKFLGSPSPGDDFYVGNARAPGLHPAALLQDSAPERAFIRELFATGRWGKLAAFWVSGSEIDWAELQASGAARRVPLPTYPFAQVRCWFEASAPDARPGASPAAALHPLLDTNLSTLHEVRFGKVFRAAEDVLRDHVVAGQSVLPGVAYLEMVRAAAARARERPVTTVSNIVWMRPLVVADTAVATFVSLVPQGERLDWEIWTQPAGERIVHARGRIAEDSPTGDATLPFDLARLTAHCTATFDRAALYRDFANGGLQYGPGLQTITQLWLGPGEALARLELPPRSARADDCLWPPGLLDGALQTIAGLNAGSQEGGLLLPFALRRLRGQGRLPDQCYALARPSAVANGQADVRKFDVHLLDDAGNLLLSLEECAFRAIRTDRPAPPGTPTPPPGAASAPDPAAEPPPAALNRLLHQLASRQIGWEEASRATRIEHLAPPTSSRPRP